MSRSTPLYNNNLEPQLKSLRQSLPQALLLTGESGVGLLTMARFLAGKHLADVVSPTATDGTVDLDKGITRVEAIRSLYSQARGKSTGLQVYILDNADRMNHTAQNAFLKLLEEPSDQTRFILTAHHPSQLLPTVRSRVQQVHVPPITSKQTDALIAELGIHDAQAAAQLRFLALGKPAQIYRLATDEQYFSSHAGYIRDAKQLLTAHRYERIIIAKRYSADREQALGLLEAVRQLSRQTLATHPTPQLTLAAARYLEALERIEANGNLRLQLLWAVSY